MKEEESKGEIKEEEAGFCRNIDDRMINLSNLPIPADILSSSSAKHDEFGNKNNHIIINLDHP